MTRILALALVAACVTTTASAQDFGLSGSRSLSFDLGLSAEIGPVYPGSDDVETSPSLIWRNFSLGPGGGAEDGLGFSLSPSLGMVGPRKSSDDADLAGLTDIDRAYELGLKVSYGAGPITAYGSVRKGFDGHEGLTGEIGAKYRTQLSERVTLWSGLELGYGDADFNDTYFGVTPAESAASGYDSFAPGGGINEAAISFEAHYALNPTTAILGEVRYGKLIGDAADSPIVQDDYQPSLRLGVIRRFSFGF